MTIQIGNVGGEVGDSETRTYLDALASWVIKNDSDLAERWIDSHKHDYIDLNQGRDFLKESKQYDVVALHNLYHPGGGEDEKRSGYYAVSPQHTAQNWRRRLVSTGAELIGVFGVDWGGDAIGDLPGYTRIRRHGDMSVYMKDKIAKRVATRYLKAISRMVFYHGTDFGNLKSIAKNGLVAHSGLKWGGGSALDSGTGAVFLTSDFNLAARYALGADREWRPVVLEVSITTPKRFKRLRYDPMDQMSSAWDVEESYDEEGGQVLRDLRGLEMDLVKHFTGQKYAYDSFVRWPDELAGLDGLNLYKVVGNQGSKHLYQKYDLQLVRRAVIQWLHKALEKYKWGYMEIKPDGTLKLTEEYFYTREQLMYMKGLPPSTIKAVWLRMEDFDLPESAYQETKFEGAKNLPGEDAGRYEALQNRVKDLRYEDPREIEDYDLADTIRFFTDYEEHEFAAYLETLTDVPQGERDPDEFQSEVEIVEAGLNEDWMQEQESAPYGWGKLELRKAARLRPKKK